MPEINRSHVERICFLVSSSSPAASATMLKIATGWRTKVTNLHQSMITQRKFCLLLSLVPLLLQYGFHFSHVLSSSAPQRQAISLFDLRSGRPNELVLQQGEVLAIEAQIDENWSAVLSQLLTGSGFRARMLGANAAFSPSPTSVLRVRLHHVLHSTFSHS